jgi:hypothetical protein
MATGIWAKRSRHILPTVTVGLVVCLRSCAGAIGQMRGLSRGHAPIEVRFTPPGTAEYRV